MAHGHALPSSLVVIVAVALAAAPARAQNADAAAAQRCIDAAARGQSLRDEGKLRASRAEFVACGADQCPSLVRKECVQWLAEVDERTPTIILSVKGARGADVVGANVSIDGKPVEAVNLGRAFPIDPGPHVVRARHGAYRPYEQQIVVRERDKGRAVEIAMAPNEAEAAAPRERGVPWLTWTLGGVAVAGGAGFGVLWAMGMDDVSNMRATCAPYCSQDRIDDVRPTFLAARISLGIGIAAAVGAVLAYALQGGSPAPQKTQSGRVAPLAPAPRSITFE